MTRTRLNTITLAESLLSTDLRVYCCADDSGDPFLAPVAQNARRVAERLADVGSPRVIGITTGHAPSSLPALLGAWLTGASVSFLSTRATPKETSAQLAQLMPGAIIHGDRDSRFHSGSHLMAGTHISSLGGPHLQQLSHRDALIAFTSGSTGAPKGAVLTAEAIWSNLGAVRDSLALTRDDIVGIFTPAHFTYALVQQLSALLGGSAVHLWPHGLSSPRALRAYLSQTGVTGIAANPTSFQLLLANADSENRFLRYVLTAGQPLTGRLARRLQSWAPNATLISGYGCTENVNRIAFFPVARLHTDHHIIAVGHPIAGTTLWLTEDREVVISGTSLMRGYLHELATADAALSEFATGDLGVLDRDGSLTLTGRLSTRINSGNEMIAPEEVEAALLGLEPIADCAVGPVDDDLLGEAVAALCVAPSFIGRGPELRRFIRSQLQGVLSPIKQPRSVYVVDHADIPRTEYGKVDRAALKSRFGLLSRGRAN